MPYHCGRYWGLFSGRWRVMERLNSYISDLRAKLTDAQVEAAESMSKRLVASLFAGSTPGFLVALETEDGHEVRDEDV